MRALLAAAMPASSLQRASSPTPPPLRNAAVEDRIEAEAQLAGRRAEAAALEAEREALQQAVVAQARAREAERAEAEAGRAAVEARPAYHKLLARGADCSAAQAERRQLAEALEALEVRQRHST